MDCRDFAENLQAYIDDELTEAERTAIDAHLESCEACSRQLRELWKLNDILHGAFSKKPSTGGLTARVVGAISDGTKSREKDAQAREPVEDDASKNLVGRTLAGYKIVEKIGSGGMGTVYRAEQLSMSRDVALKVLYHRYSQDEVFVKRFIREARSAGGLNHSNIVRVYDVGQENGFYFMSMEFIKGRSIHEILLDEGRMEPERALDVVTQTARALEHAQKNGIIHRDVKPENIIIDEEGHVKLADLGLAKNIGMAQEASMTVEGQVMGTPQYMSPEQVTDSSSVDHRTDIYSLGASLYYMVTGDRPFEGNTAVEIMVAVIHDEVRFKKEHYEYVPRQVMKVIEKAMAKDANRRHQTATELVKELEYIRSRPLTLAAQAAAPKPRAVRSAVARREREPVSVQEKKAASYMWVAAVAAGLLLVIGLLIAFSGGKPEKPREEITYDDSNRDNNRKKNDEKKQVQTPPPPPPIEMVKKPEFDGKAKKEWEAVLSLYTQHPDDYAEILRRLSDIYNGYPSSSYAEKAEKLHSQVTKQLDEAFAKARTQSDELKRTRDFNGAIALWAEFEKKHAGTEVAEAAAGYRRELKREFYARFDRDMRVADAKYKKGNIDGAMYDYEKIQKYGDEDMKKKAADQMAAIEAGQKALAHAKEEEKRTGLLDDFYRQTVVPMIDKQFGKVASLVDSAAIDPKYAAIKKHVDLERADMAHLMELKEVLNNAFRKMMDSPLDVSINLRDRSKRVIGKIKEMSPDMFVLKPPGRDSVPITLRMTSLEPGEVVRLTKGMFKDETDSLMKLYLFYLYEADFSEALAYLDKLSGRKRAFIDKENKTGQAPEKESPGESGQSSSEKIEKMIEKIRKGEASAEDAAEKIRKDAEKFAQEQIEKLRRGEKPDAGGGPVAKPPKEVPGVEVERTEQIIDPGDPKYAICYDKFDVVKPLIKDVMADRIAKKLYDGAKRAYRKKDYEDAQEICERLLSGEFARTSLLAQEGMRDEIAKLLKNIEAKMSQTLAKKEVEEDEIASLFNASKVEKLKGGKYRFTYDFSSEKQLTDFMAGDNPLKEDRAKELFAWASKKVTKYEEAPAWAVVSYQKHHMVAGKGDRAFRWKGIVDGDVTLEFSAIPLRLKNVMGMICHGGEGAYIMAISYDTGDVDRHHRIFGRTRTVLFRDYWEDEPHIRLLNGNWKTIGSAAVSVVKLYNPYMLKLVRKDDALALYVNGERYAEGKDNTWHKGRVGLWARETNVLFTNVRITGKLDQKWVEEEIKRLGRDKKEDREKKPEVAKKEDPYKGASPTTTRLLDEAKKLEGITNEDLLRLRKLADMADGMGDWADRIFDRLAGEIRRMKNAEELRRRLDEIERWLNGPPGGNPPGGWPGPGGGNWPGGGRPGGGGGRGGGGRGGGR